MLYLSKNCLTSLNEIQQFHSLRIFSCADNLLVDFDCLNPLSALRTLEAVNFERNPISRLPNYRAQVCTLVERVSHATPSSYVKSLLRADLQCGS